MWYIIWGQATYGIEQTDVRYWTPGLRIGKQEVEAVQQEIIEIVRAAISNKTSEILDDAALVDELGLDSVGLLTVISNLEDRFGIVFEDEDLELDNFHSINTICALVQRRDHHD